MNKQGEDWGYFVCHKVLGKYVQYNDMIGCLGKSQVDA
jgi:hypothetical protein